MSHDIHDEDTGPCPLGESCPDARKHGHVHPAPTPTVHDILHVLRNPAGWGDAHVRTMRLAACDLIEAQELALAVESGNGTPAQIARYSKTAPNTAARTLTGARELTQQEAMAVLDALGDGDVVDDTDENELLRVNHPILYSGVLKLRKVACV